ncbi:MAG: branched-chain amino acid ABC transporter permease [Clostridia bacterium]|nr:branched-chain amino acid ABC transporter permease [Anaerotignum sp.]NCC15879.1 branched-chain amino acid ABC transporter permease [Clostridia bacterium]
MTEKKKTQLNILFSVIALLVCAGILYYVNHYTKPTFMLRTVLQLGAIYALVAVSMNLLNGFTGLFSLGQAGFMAVGAYAFAIFTIPAKSRPGVYYLYGVADWLSNLQVPIWAGLVLAGLVAAILAAIIGAPVLRLKSDYFAIATLGFAEIVRIIVGSSPMNRITNGSLGLKMIPKFPNFYFPFVVVGICILIISLLIRSSYGRAFKAIREDEIAAEAMGINLAKHKQLSFIISSFFAGIGGALMGMYLGAITSSTFNIPLTYNILLIVVIGGMGSVTGSILSSFLVIAAREWWLRFLDMETFIGGFKVPLLKSGFRMVVFSIILMLVVLFFRRGIMGMREFNWNFILKRLGKKKNAGGEGCE